MNLILYSAATPQYDDEEEKWDPEKDWNNPDNNEENNNENEDEEEFIKEY